MCDMARWSPIDSRCYSGWWKCTSMYKTPLQKYNILMCFTHWINLLFTLKVATTVLGSAKFLLLWIQSLWNVMACWIVSRKIVINPQIWHLLNRQIYCDVAENLQILIISSVFLNYLWNTWGNSCDGDPSNFHRPILLALQKY